MARWTKEGWELLENIALNAYMFTGLKSSAFKVMNDALRVSTILERNPGIGKTIKNIFGEDRYWHPFHEGKVLIWKLDEEGILFVAAYYSLPKQLIL